MRTIEFGPGSTPPQVEGSDQRPLFTFRLVWFLPKLGTRSECVIMKSCFGPPRSCVLCCASATCEKNAPTEIVTRTCVSVRDHGRLVLCEVSGHERREFGVSAAFLLS